MGKCKYPPLTTSDGTATVWGPYRCGKRFRIAYEVRGGGRTYGTTFETESAALEDKRRVFKTLEATTSLCASEAIDMYEQDRKDRAETKARSDVETTRRLRKFFPTNEIISAITAQRGQEIYDTFRATPTRRGQMPSVDYHRNVLSEARTFLAWCVDRKWARLNALDGVKGTGRRRHGKEQLRFDEGHAWIVRAIELANEGYEGAVAALMTIMLGVRASEVVLRVVRDLDQGGRLLWIPDAKTPAGRRTVKVPPRLQRYLLAFAAGRPGEANLFPDGPHDRHFPRKWVQRICREARVPVVTAHGMRGLRATLGVDKAELAELAALLGHDSDSVTRRSYIAPGTIERVEQDAVTRAIDQLLGDAPQGGDSTKQDN